MAGGKETPRQKMIGMMYLVLTALLALNVSKQIVAAFVTINDKLDASGEIISEANKDIYQGFQAKRLALKTTGGDTKAIEMWEAKADKLNARTKQVVSFFLTESSEMMEVAEGVSWIKETDDDGNVTELRSLMEVSAMDNYDIPTNRYIGGNPTNPKAEGLALRDTILAYRDEVATIMATYSEGTKNWSFTPPEKDAGPDALTEALKTVNPKDTSIIAKFYKSLSVPAELEINDGGEKKMMPWPSVMFDHAPIVAAGAMLTSIKVDVKNAETTAAGFMLGKVDAPTFNFNKIEPMAFASTGYINSGDSIKLRVMIAAYDSTEVPKIKYGIDGDSQDPAKFKSTTGGITLRGAPGKHDVKGVIGVKERGQIAYKPWEFSYEVGKPSGAVSLPEMNVLYRGYDNKVTGAASGFSGYKLSMSNGSISKKGEFWIAKPGKGREASVTITGVQGDKTAKLGTFPFRVMTLPTPDVRLGGIKDGDKVSKGKLKGATKFFAGYGPEIPLKAEFRVTGWTLTVSGAPKPVKGTGNKMSAKGMSLLKQTPKNGAVILSCSVVGPDKVIKRKNMSFVVQ